MSKKKWHTHDDYEPKVPVKLDDMDIVERDSYIDPKKQIEQMVMAGVRLNQYRKEEFDTFEGHAEEDITRNSGFDIIDAQKVAEALNARKKEETPPEPPASTPTPPAEEEVKKL